jgi:hypothetical protein
MTFRIAIEQVKVCERLQNLHYQAATHHNVSFMIYHHTPQPILLITYHLHSKI